jgi:hypothetical protein
MPLDALDRPARADHDSAPRPPDQSIAAADCQLRTGANAACHRRQLVLDSRQPVYEGSSPEQIHQRKLAIAGQADERFQFG